MARGCLLLEAEKQGNCLEKSMHKFSNSLITPNVLSNDDLKNFNMQAVKRKICIPKLVLKMKNRNVS